ncbi:MAG: hypothetical protein HC845_14530 [Akkermansiaceae bacterium]|nr:hypothetical protein [Akkermansiaceae bacterium]
MTKKQSPAKKSVPIKKSIPTKKAAPAKKAVVKKSVKKASLPAKPVKKSPEKSPKPTKAVKSAEVVPTKAPAKAVEKVVKAVAKEPAVVAPVKIEATPAPVKVAAPAKKPASKGSSLIDYPVPPAPVKPPFVPPKSTTPASSDEPIATGPNGTHSPAFILKQKQRLLDLRDELVDAVSGMARDTIRNAPEGSEASGSGQHQGDAGSDAYDRDFALSVLAKEQDALYEIEQALRRIQSNTYGVCEMSSRKSPNPSRSYSFRPSHGGMPSTMGERIRQSPLPPVQ